MGLDIFSEEGLKLVSDCANKRKPPPLEIEGLQKTHHLIRNSITIPRNFIPETGSVCD